MRQLWSFGCMDELDYTHTVHVRLTLYSVTVLLPPLLVCLGESLPLVVRLLVVAVA